MKAFPNYIIIKPIEQEEVTEGGIYLPQERKDIPQEGIVVDSGVSSVSKGVKVWFKMWAGEDVKFEDEEYKIVHIKDLLAYEV